MVSNELTIDLNVFGLFLKKKKNNIMDNLNNALGIIVHDNDRMVMKFLCLVVATQYLCL